MQHPSGGTGFGSTAPRSGERVLTVARSQPCVICGTDGDCPCDAVTSDLRGLAAVYADQALACARARKYHEARRTFALSESIVPLDGRSAFGLGLCCLALGDLRGAAAAWRDIADRDDDDFSSRARATLAALESAKLSVVIDAYNTALSHARNGMDADALRTIEGSRKLLSPFLPTLRLEMVVRQRSLSNAHTILELSSQFPDDPDVVRLADAVRSPVATPAAPPVQTVRRLLVVAAACLACGLALGSAMMRTEPGSAPSARAIAAPPTPAPDIIGRVTTLALGATVPRLMELRDVIATQSISLDTTTLRLLQARLDTAAHAAYRRALQADRRGAIPGVISLLSEASEASPRVYFRDDALYLLATRLGTAGNLDSARRVASRLLREHPASALANTTMRRLADQLSTPAP